MQALAGHITAEFSAKTYAKSNPKDLRINKSKIKEQKIELLNLLENSSSAGQKLKALRLDKGLTLKALSDLTGIAKSTLCDYEVRR